MILLGEEHACFVQMFDFWAVAESRARLIRDDSSLNSATLDFGKQKRDFSRQKEIICTEPSYGRLEAHVLPV
jgi:hypothetical protein